MGKWESGKERRGGGKREVKEGWGIANSLKSLYNSQNLQTFFGNSD